MNRHQNFEAFFEFLRGSLKDPSLLDTERGRAEWVKDFEAQTAVTGGEDYEIPGRLTRSGNPELYRFRRAWYPTDDGEEDFEYLHG
jgi:hypothetical protein